MESSGYAGKLLIMDLTTGTSRTVPTSEYTDLFLGGRGIAQKLYWDEASPDSGALDPGNAVIFATGPLAGVPVIGGGRWFVCGKSPITLPERFSYCNLGGDWGIRLKSAGYDAVVVKGKAARPVYLRISEDAVEIVDASHLWGNGTISTRRTLEVDGGGNTSVVTIGQAGENLATMACLMASEDAAGGGGMGAVMGSKNLKAIAVRSDRRRTQAARPQELKELTREFRSILTLSPTATAGGIDLRITGPGTTKSPCWSCIGDCLRRSYQAQDGSRGKFMCQAGTFYQPAAEAVYGPGYEMPYFANKLCDDYGLDTMAVSLIMLWLMRCARAGILTDESGIPLSRLGTAEYIENLVKKIALRDGVGDVLAGGVEKAAEQLGPEAVTKLLPSLCKAGLPNGVDSRLYLNTALMVAMEPKPPLGHTHEITRVVLRWIDWRRGVSDSYVSPEVFRRVADRFWGGEEAADFCDPRVVPSMTRIVQDRQYSHDCLVICGFLWPVTDSRYTSDHLGDPSLESKLVSAITGRNVNEQGLHEIGERAVNLHRAILIREGHRGVQDDRLPDTWHSMPLKADMTNPELLVPGRDGEAASRQGKVVEKEEFAAMRRAYYRLRGWNEDNGLPTRQKMVDLGLGDVAEDLAKSCLLG